MPRIFLIADTHLGDDVIIKLEHRPFKNAKEQDRFHCEKLEQRCKGR